MEVSFSLLWPKLLGWMVNMWFSVLFLNVGKVTKGMDIAKTVEKLGSSSGRPIKQVTIKTCMELVEEL